MRIEKPVDAVAKFHEAAGSMATPETEAASTMSDRVEEVQQGENERCEKVRCCSDRRHSYACGSVKDA